MPAPTPGKMSQEAPDRPERTSAIPHLATISFETDTRSITSQANSNHSDRHPEGELNQARLLAVMQSHSGPLPDPTTLQAYDSIVPGSAAKIIVMAETEQRHRHRLESLEHLYPFIGMGLGFVALLMCIAGGIHLATLGNTTIALALLAAPLIGSIGWFVKGRLTKET